MTSPYAGLSGAAFGIDFNPVVDRLRIVSTSGQNLRVNVSTGATLTDGAVNVPAGGQAPGVLAVAYSNNDNNPATGTTLFDIGSATDALYTQTSAAPPAPLSPR